MKGLTVYELMELLMALPEEQKRRTIFAWDGNWANPLIIIGMEKSNSADEYACLRVEDDNE